MAAAIPIVAAVAGGLISSSGAKSAAKTQANAAQRATDTQMHMYDQTRSDLMPYSTFGAGALSQLASLFGLPGAGGGGGFNPTAAASALTQAPGYQFGLDQGVEALDRSAASKGLVHSGAQLKDAQAYGQGYAMEHAWLPYISQLNQMASLGENAAAQTGNFGQTAAGGAGAAQIYGGEATASGQLAGSNQLANLFQNQMFQNSLGSFFNGRGSGSAYDSTGLVHELSHGGV